MVFTGGRYVDLRGHGVPSEVYLRTTRPPQRPRRCCGTARRAHRQQRVEPRSSACSSPASSGGEGPGLTPRGALALGRSTSINEAGLVRPSTTGVYGRGFARSQAAYREASIQAVSQTFSRLEERLASRCYLLGEGRPRSTGRQTQRSCASTPVLPRPLQAHTSCRIAATVELDEMERDYWPHGRRLDQPEPGSSRSTTLSRPTAAARPPPL